MHVIEACGGDEVWLHAFLTSKLDIGKRSVSGPPPSRYLLNRRMGRP